MAHTKQPAGAQFELQRDVLCQEIELNLEKVLQNLNKLNRSLEGITAVGNELSSVEALWTQFENVMDKQASTGEDNAENERTSP